MSKYNINLLECPRVELGWGYLQKITEYLAAGKSNHQLVYLFESRELIITHPDILVILLKLEIPFIEKMPQNSFKFIVLKNG